MSEFLRALGYDPLRYWLLAWTCLGLWSLACALPCEPLGPPGRRLGSMLNYAVLLLAAMIAFRWPAVCGYVPVNPDEPQFLAGALTMLARHEFWWPDAMSSGPLVLAPLTLPAVFGLPLDYAAGRAIGLLLSWGVVLFVCLALRHAHGDRLGRLLSLPLACFMILLNFWDFTAYASECLPLFLCSAAAWLALTAFAADGTVGRRWRLAAAGGVLGILPFSKLQALPLGAAIGLASVILVLRQPGVDWRRRGRDLLVVVGPTVTALLVFLLWAWSSGNAAHLGVAYVRHNLFYAQDRAVPWTESIAEFRYLSDFSWGFSAFHYGLLLLFGVGLLALRWWPRAAWRPVGFGWCLLAAAYFAVLAPGRAYPHYLLFITMPLALAAGLQFGYLLRAEAISRALKIRLIVLLVLAGAGGQLADRLLTPHPFLRLIPEGRPRAAIVAMVGQLKQPGDALAVWGWRPELYVETQLPQAVRDAHTERQMQDNPQRAYFRARYLADVSATRPAFFVDAVGRGGFLYQDRATSGLETFPELNDFVAGQYQLLGEVDTFRLYLRRDRLPPAAR
jgi:hypothetical protein